MIKSRVTLTARTSYALSVLKIDGRVWIIREYRDKVLGLNGKSGYLLESLITGSLRWVRDEGDIDFKIGFLSKN